MCQLISRGTRGRKIRENLNEIRVGFESAGGRESSIVLYVLPFSNIRTNLKYSKDNLD